MRRAGSESLQRTKDEAAQTRVGQVAFPLVAHEQEARDGSDALLHAVKVLHAGKATQADLHHVEHVPVKEPTLHGRSI